METLYPTKISIISHLEELEILLIGLNPSEVTDEFIDYFADRLYDFLKEKKKNIFLNVQGEGFPAWALIMTSNFIKRLDKKYPASFNKFIIKSGGADIVENYKFYNQHCDYYDLFKAEIQFYNTLEFLAGNWIREDLQLYENFDSSPRIRLKKFLSFNGSSKSHRFYLASQMIKHNLLDKTLFTMQIGREPKSNLLNHFNYIVEAQLKYFLPNTYKEVEKTIKDNINLFPINLNWKDNEIFPDLGVKGEIEYYNNTYFSLVTESKFFKDLPEFFIDPQMDGYFFTEKTFKPIMAKHPFILMGRPGSMNILKRLGYKTFHPLINEDYDSVENDEDRLTVIINEVLRLCEFSDNDWIQWQENIRPIVEHNFQHLIERSKNLRL